MHQGGPGSRRVCLPEDGMLPLGLRVHTQCILNYPETDGTAVGKGWLSVVKPLPDMPQTQDSIPAPPKKRKKKCYSSKFKCANTTWEGSQPSVNTSARS